MNTDYQSVLQRLREERKRQNLTQRLLLYCTGMQQSQYSKAETGHERFSYHELKGLCTSEVDVLYVFTGKKANGGQQFPGASEARLEEIMCHLNTVYILASAACSMNRNKAAFEKVRQELGYIQCWAEDAGTNNNIFRYMRDRFGYTQQQMADILDVDIKKLRGLEKGKQLPDSAIIWKMYSHFQVSPSFILNDPKGLWGELNYVLSLLEDSDREVILRILENGHKLLAR